ncbi:protein adenylyltransferase Fic [Leptotrichia sp. oral taxon 879]|uniref:protein adenylyltransferase Fic n=1 Tax=Leptotrichia sp. oral taxon 879 TaxID=1227267 RepID=UPI0003AE4D0D|nr:Fic family protein [Leptotrichia sp. oral taxon 879]ERK55002.1 Fic family protein [Leptotrichia sp. oral taxon 879 str. F0557]
MANNKDNWENESDKILKRLVSQDDEEFLSKKRAKELFDNGILKSIQVGTFEGLKEIHRYLFQECYGTAGKIREHDIRKGDTVFCRAMYLEDNLKTVSKMPENNFEEIIEKYVEMNIMHPFYEGNGRTTRIWLDQMLIRSLGMCVNWQNISRNDYLSAMKRSVVNDLELKFLLKENLTGDIKDRDVFMNGINQSYEYENMKKYDVKELEVSNELGKLANKKGD